MQDHKATHKSIIWCQQKLNELDAMITELETSAKSLKGQAKADGEKALERIRTSREAFEAEIERARADTREKVRGEAAQARKAMDNARDELEDQWIEAELAFQTFLTERSNDAEAARKAFAARSKATREALDRSVDEFHKETEAAMHDARDKLDAALDRLSKEIGKLETEADKVSAVGSESWRSVRDGLKQAHAVHVNTAKNVAEAFRKLH